jgi:RecB family exonuclease
MAVVWSNRFFFCGNEEKRRFENRQLQILMEDVGKLVIPYDAGEFFLTARADRIDMFSCSEAKIIDYKKGHIPTDIEIKGSFARH